MLTDELTRCKEDDSLKLMRDDFCLSSGKYCDIPNKPNLKHASDIKLHLEKIIYFFK